MVWSKPSYPLYTPESYRMHNTAMPVHSIEWKGPFCLKREPVKTSSTSDRQTGTCWGKGLSHWVTSTGPGSSLPHLAMAPSWLGPQKVLLPADVVYLRKGLSPPCSSFWFQPAVFSRCSGRGSRQHTVVGRGNTQEKPCFWNADPIHPVDSWSIWSFCWKCWLGINALRCRQVAVFSAQRIKFLSYLVLGQHM